MDLSPWPPSRILIRSGDEACNGLHLMNRLARNDEVMRRPGGCVAVIPLELWKIVSAVMLDGSLQGDCEFETKTDKNRPTQTSGYSKSAEMPPKKSCHLKTVLVEMQIQPLNYPIKVYPVGTPPSSSWELAQLLRTSSLYSLERRVIPKFRVPSGKPSHNYA